MSKKKEVLKTSPGAVATPPVSGSTWSDEWGNDVSARDLVIPKVLLMQGMSKLVTNGDAVMGELRESLENKLVGGVDSPMNFIPFNYERFWAISKFDGTQYKYIHSEPVSASNERAQQIQWENADGKYRRDFVYRFYVIRPEEVAEDVALPYAIDFKRTSNRAGKKLVTQCWVKSKMAGLNPASKVMQLVVLRDTKDGNTYVKYDVAVGRDSTASEIAAALQVRKMVSAVEIKVADTEVSDNKGNQAPQDPPSPDEWEENEIPF